MPIDMAYSIRIQNKDDIAHLIAAAVVAGRDIDSTDLFCNPENRIRGNRMGCKSTDERGDLV